MRAPLLLLVGALVMAVPTFPQSRVSGPTPSVLFGAGPSGRALDAPWAADTNKPTSHPTHWKEGALIGGLLGAIGGALLGYGVCQTGDDTGSNCVGTTVGVAATGVLVLGLTGALIGGAFPKEGNAESP